MPTKERRTRLQLVDRGPDESVPALAVIAVARDGGVLQSAAVGDDGAFDLSKAAVEKAHRVLIGPADTAITAETRSAFSRYRSAEFAAALDGGTIAVARPQWERWRISFSCVSGSVRLCRHAPWWYDDLQVLARESLVRQATLPPVTRQSPAASIAELIAWPVRCRTICNGRVEVYRRTCCCKPWIIDDPRLPELVLDLEDLLNPPIPDPPIPDPPFPGAIPAPFVEHPAVRSGFFRDGTLNEIAIYAARDLQMIRSLPRQAVAEYVNARPYLLCRGYSCSSPVKVGEGDINPDGRFNICFLNLTPLPNAGCHHEYAYKVRQRFGPFQVIVYNGVAANQWFNAGADATLSTSHPLAFACRENGEPGTGAFVYLDIIGDTSSHELETPASTGWDRTAAFGPTSGLVFPDAASPLDRHRNWGGTLKLNYMFSEDLKLVGAKYYRISVTRATSGGVPIGDREYYNQGLSWRKSVVIGGVHEIVPVNLGPNPVDGAGSLYEIPYDADADWEAGQYHAFIDTNDARWNDPNVRHLITVEVFDQDGKRLRPNGTPATGQPGGELTAAFTYRRKTAETGPTDEVPFGALTHAFWWDNRKLEAAIVELVKDTIVSNQECQFLTGTGDSRFGITYRAYHPRELFQRRHEITWKRGLNGAEGTILADATSNVGQPPADPDNSPTASFDDLLGPHTRCAFTVFLNIQGKTTDGESLSYPERTESAAFALEKAT